MATSRRPGWTRTCRADNSSASGIMRPAVDLSYSKSGVQTAHSQRELSGVHEGSDQVISDLYVHFVVADFGLVPPSAAECAGE
jgi:hypothetical protein